LGRGGAGVEAREGVEDAFEAVFEGRFALENEHDAGKAQGGGLAEVDFTLEERLEALKALGGVELAVMNAAQQVAHFEERLGQVLA